MLPIVLHHGIFNLFTFKVGKLKVCSFSGGIEDAIAERGHPLIVSKVHPTAGIATRAQQLKDTILRQLNQMGRSSDKVVILAHSMGGLDARYMISRLGMAERVAALTTISTPHRGSTYASFCRHHLCDRLGGFDLARYLRLDIDAVNDLTPESCERFNAEIEDNSPVVRYFSISGARPDNRVPAFAYHAWRTIYQAEGANDGLVSLNSSVWGEHLGTWPLDHWHQVNKRFIFDRGGIGNVAPMYVRLLEQIQEAGVDLGQAVEQSSALQSA